MSYVDTVPSSNIPKIVLPSQGVLVNVNKVSDPLPFSLYTDDQYFLEGCVDQVSYTFDRLGGRTLDIEISEHDVYSHYQAACMRYSYLVNYHHAKSILGNVLGTTQGSFDEEGNLTPDSDIPAGSHVELTYPKNTLNAARRIGEALATEAMVGGYTEVYRTGFELVGGQQDYDLQAIIKEQSETDDTTSFYGKITDGVNNKIIIRKIYYKSPMASWRFYGYFGAGLTVMGNLSTYGQWADDSQFQVIPVWQNRLQAMAYEDSLHVRLSHYSYEIKNNKVRLYPIPGGLAPTKMYVEFTISESPWGESGDEDTDGTSGVGGINNVNTLPFENIPFQSINSMGKEWIRRFALALSKEDLGYVRTKFNQIPFPNQPLVLNGERMLSDAKDEQRELTDELIQVLEDTQYDSLLEREKNATDNAQSIMSRIPIPIFVG